MLGFSASTGLAVVGLVVGRMLLVEDDRFKPWAAPLSGLFMAGMLTVLIVGTTVSAALGGYIAGRERP